MKFGLFCNIFVNSAQKHFVFIRSIIKIMSFNVIAEKSVPGYFCTAYTFVYNLLEKIQ